MWLQALQNAAEIFNKGAERIKKNYQESVEKLSKSSEFYSQLWALRQNWRIKKVGQNILGDLSYKSGTLATEYLSAAWSILYNEFWR